MYFNFSNGMNRNDNIEQRRPCGYPGNNGFPGNGGCPGDYGFPGSGRYPEDDCQALRDQWVPEDAPEHRALPDQLVPWGLRAM